MDAISNALETVQKNLPGLKYRLNEPMRDHTSFKTGGPVRAMYFPGNAAMMGELLGILVGSGVVPLVMGNGTNLLVDDKPLEIIVVKTTGLDDLRRTGRNMITADAGVLLSRLAVFACECGLSGLEFAHGIPGTLGGAVSMNAGAYGAEMADVVISTTAVGTAAESVTVSGVEHVFSYRRSRFSESGEVIISSVIQLEEGETASIRTEMDKLSDRRRESQPLDLPSAGSIFKRPEVGYAAELIERAGLKGFSHGGAQVSDKHSGFIVNRGGASFSDVMAVIGHVKETVFKLFGTELELEIKIVS